MSGELAAHPVADLFPLLATDELADLAADIRQRGLLHPIVLDTEGRILDGRNRLAACEQAEIQPEFVTYDGDDPAGYALAVNIVRRHLTKGQQAMIIVEAGAYTEYTHDQADATGVSRSYVSRARIVKEYASALVGAVVSGAETLNKAYDVAQAEKEKSEGREAQLARLRAEYPELADRVVEGDLTLPGAWAEQKARAAQRESERRASIANLRSVLTYLVSASIQPDELAENDYADAVDEFKQDDLDYATATMAAIADLKRGA